MDKELELGMMDIIAVIGARLRTIERWKGGYAANLKVLVLDLDSAVQKLKEMVEEGNK